MIDRNDPRLTAYALGELDAAERAEFEKMLPSDPAARAEVEAIQALGGQLRAEFAKSPAPALTEAQRTSVARASRRRVPPAIVLVPIAACLLGAAVLFWPEPPAASPTIEAKHDSESRTGLAFVDPAYTPPPALDAVPPSGDLQTVQGFRGPNGGVPPGIRDLDSEKNAPAPGLRQPGDPEPPPPPPSDPGCPPPGPTTPAGPPVAMVLEVTGGDGGGAHARKALEAEELIRRLEVENAAFRNDPRFKKRYAEVLRELERAGRAFDREAYDRIRENPFLRVAEEDSSTFSIDVDTASYANVRRFLAQEHRLPPPDAVRVEEMINYFAYGYEPPAAGSPHPFRIHVEVAQCPWDAAHRLARVAIKGKVIDHRERPASNLVFLVDVSGSMDEPSKLPLVQASLRLLAENLGEKDRVAIVVYAGAAGLVLPSTGDKQQVVEAIERLRAGGSTAGAAGIELAYRVAAENFLKDGVNRVILCTDGDFNVGISDDGSLTRLIEEKAKAGVFLSVLGYGTGNYQDAKMQQLADKGNGNHAYIDSILEARKVLGEEMSGTLVTIAKDVKIQLFFNPRKVAAFRLIGYENRLLAKQDFNDDTKDAGEIGAGHCVTALYELVPAGSEVQGLPAVDRNPFVPKAEAAVDAEALFQLRLRYKRPDGDKSDLIEAMVRDGNATFDAASPDFRWASAVAAFGMNLRGTAGMGLDAVKEIAKGAAGDDKYRREFLDLVETAKLLSR
jgi:Ca-activated chloride channel family protein